MSGNSKNELESGQKGKSRVLTDEEAKAVIGGVESDTPGSQPSYLQKSWARQAFAKMLP
jgi:hypothetical protein